MAAIAEFDSEAHVESSAVVNSLQSEIPIVGDLSQMVSSPIECVLSTPSTSALELEPAAAPDPVPTCVLLLDGTSTTSTTTFVSSPIPSTEESLTVVTGKRNPRRSFTTEFKLECVEHAERTKNKTETARKFNVNRRRVQEWCLQKQKLMSLPKQQKRLGGRGRKSGGLENDHLLTSKVASGFAVGGGGAVSEEPGHLLNPDTLIESIAKGLSMADLSLLSPSMIKTIQDLSSDLASQYTKTAAESVIRDVYLELLMQKGGGLKSTQKDDGSPQDAVVDSEELETATEVAISTQETEQITDYNSLVTDIVTAEANQHQNVGILSTTSSSSSSSVAKPPETAVASNVADISAQAALLDALMQAATSVQVPASELLHPSLQTTTGSGQQPQLMLASSPGGTTEVKTMAKEAGSPVQMEVECGGAPQSPSRDVEPQGVSVAVSNGGGITGEDAPPISSGADDNLSAIAAAQQPSGGYRTRIKKFYTVDFKLDCVAFAESNSKCAAARRFDVNRRRVQDWCTQKEKLLQLKKMASGDEEEPMNIEADIEKELATLIKQQLASGKSLTRRMVKAEAMRMFRERGVLGFTGNVAWVAKFMIRNDISLVSSSPSRLLSSPAVSEVAEDRERVGAVGTDGVPPPPHTTPSDASNLLEEPTP